MIYRNTSKTSSVLERFNSISCVGVLLLIALFSFAVYHIKDLTQETDITRFLPDDENREQLEISLLFRGTEMGRSMIIQIQPDEKVHLDRVVQFSDEFTDRLLKSGHFTRVENGKNQTETVEIFFNLYFKRRYMLASEEPEKFIPQWITDPGLNQAASTLKSKLRSPMSSFISRIAPIDPYLLMPRILERVQAEGKKIQPYRIHDRYSGKDGRTLLILAQTIEDPFHTRQQTQVIDEVLEIFHELRKEFKAQIQMEYTGINRFSIDGERLIRRDINRAFFISSCGVIILFLVFFRNIFVLFIAISPAIFGVVFSLGLCTAMFGKLHGLTIAFGASLIGICIDYSVHILNHFWLADSPGHIKQGMPVHLKKSLIMSCVTTLIGFMAMGFSDFPGIRQIAFFAVAGIGFAFLYSIIMIPILARVFIQYFKPVKDWIPATITGIQHWAHRFRNIILPVVIILVILGGIQILTIEIHTDIRSLNSTDPKTLAVDKAIRSELPSSLLIFL